jgi:hypothetical protein
MNKFTAKLFSSFTISLLAIASTTLAQVPPAAAPTPPAPAPASTGGAKIAFATPVYDFGKVKSGEMVKHSFIFTNLGTDLLVVSNVAPSCGCTTSGDWTRQVEPGKTGSIPVQFNSANFKGMVMKTVTVTCNDTAQPSLMLQIKGTVWTPIDISPQFAALNVPAESREPTKTLVKIVNNTESPITLTQPESNHKSIKAELQTIQEGKEFQVTISAVPPLDPGTVQGQITFKSIGAESAEDHAGHNHTAATPADHGHSQMKTNPMTISVWVNVQAAVMASPAQIMLPAGPLLGTQNASVTIHNNGATNITLSDAKVDVEGVDVKITELQPGKMFAATLTFPEKFEVAQGTQIHFSVKTSHPDFAVVKVPIMQIPRVNPPPASATAPLIVPLTPPVPQTAAKPPVPPSAK